MAQYVNTEKSRIIIHGTNTFKSSQLLNQLGIKDNANAIKEFEFFPFTDLNVNEKYPLFHANNEMMNLIEQSVTGVKVSTVLLLISQSGVFSKEMSNLIMKLPSNKFYGFNEKTVKEWWNYVTVVFSFEQEECKNEEQVKRSIDTNRGIKEIVKLVDQRYICMSNSTTSSTIYSEMLQVQKKKKNSKESLIIGGQAHSIWYHEILPKRLPAREPGPKEFFKTFILLGERKSGKGSLGNLLLGQRESPLLATGLYSKPFGMVKKFPKGYFNFDLVRHEKDFVFTQTRIIQIVDQPGDIKLKHYSEFLLNCFKEMKISEHLIFLILIDLSTCVFTKEELFKIEEIAKILKFHELDFFSNALLIFTHADLMENPDQTLVSLMKSEDYLCIKKLMKSIKHNHIFINAVNFSDKNRNEVLNKVNQSTIQRSNPCHNEDIENPHDIGYIIAKTLKTLNRDIYTPICVIVIDFERLTSTKNIPELKLTKIFKNATRHEESEFWENAYFIFKGKDFDEKPFEPLIEKLNKKFIWIKSAKDLSTNIQYFLDGKLLFNNSTQEQTKKYSKTQEEIDTGNDTDILNNKDEETSSKPEDSPENKGRQGMEEKGEIDQSTHNSFCSKKYNPEVLISSNMLFGSGDSNIPPLSYFILVKDTPVSS